MGNGRGMIISHIGTAALPSLSRPLILNNILQVPNITHNLLSIQQLTRDNNIVEFHLIFYCEGSYISKTSIMWVT